MASITHKSNVETKTKRQVRRRGNGEGSIFQRADGRWAATIVVGRNAVGKRIRRTVYGNRKQDVQAKLTEMMSRKRAGTLTAANRETVADYLKWWLENVAQLKVRPTTYVSYADAIRKHINPRIGGVKLQALSPMAVVGFLADMDREKCSPRLRQLAYATLRTA
jgi:hypothetical protein